MAYKMKFSHKKRNKIFVGTMVLLILVLVIVGYFVNYQRTHPVEDINITNNSDNYISSSNEYSLKYPDSYEHRESTTSNSIMLFLSKDQVWDSEGSNLEKGVSIIGEYKKNTNLTKDYVNEDIRATSEIYKDTKIDMKKINNLNAIQAQYAFNHPLNVISTLRVKQACTSSSIDTSKNIFFNYTNV